jgi:DNA repair protein RadD
MPTGAGKTHVIGGMCRYVLEHWPDAKVLIVSHVREILQQNADALRNYVPSDRIGIFSAGLKSREIAQFTVAGIQSIYDKPDFEEHRLVIVDEAHLIPPTGEGRYRTFFKNNPDVRVVGLTATPFRLGLGMLTDGLFDSIVYNVDVLKLIKEGYLCPLMSKATTQKMNVRDVKVIGGDYNLKQLSSSLDKTSITKHIVRELMQHKDIRKHWLVFAIDIAHAEHLTEELCAAGISARCVHSKMKADRDEYTEQFKQGAFQALVSVETLTTGFDAPNVDLIALLRPTMSPVLHIQMIGRGLRSAPDKKNCLVLDFAGNVARLGPINHVKPPRAGVKQGNGQMPTKECPQCHELVHLSAHLCPTCNYEFPAAAVKLLRNSDASEVIRESMVAVHPVTRMSYTAYSGPSGWCLKVSYHCGLRVFDQFVFPEGKIMAMRNFRAWWTWPERNPKGISVPRNVREALQHTAGLVKPARILVDDSGKYPIIKQCFWSE